VTACVCAASLGKQLSCSSCLLCWFAEQKLLTVLVVDIVAVRLCMTSLYGISNTVRKRSRFFVTAVNLVYPYDALEAINVQGTAHVVSFARTGKVKALHFVSTNGIFAEKGPTQTINESEFPSHHLLESGYGQTKWVAEQIVVKAHALGLPGSIFRLGNVGGPRNGSCWNTSDSNLIFMKRCLADGIIPDAQWEIEFTPVSAESWWL
jgi:hypothetical protein